MPQGVAFEDDVGEVGDCCRHECELTTGEPRQLFTRCCGRVRGEVAEQHKREQAAYGEAKRDSQGARDVKRKEWAEHFFRGSEEGRGETDEKSEGSHPHRPLDCASHLAAMPRAVGTCGEPKKEARYDGRDGAGEQCADD